MSGLAAALLLASALKGTLNASDRTAVYTVSGAADSSSIVAAADVSNSPVLSLGLDLRQWTFDVSYLPQFTLHIAEPRVGFEALHSGRLGAAWANRTNRISLSQELAYGGLLFSTLLTQSLLNPATGRVETLPAADRVSILSYRTSLGLSSSLSRRTTMSADIGINGSGGENEVSRRTMPSQFGPQAGLRFRHTLSRISSITPSMAFSWTRFSSGEEYGIIDTALQGQYRLSRFLDGTAGLGVSATASRSASGGGQFYAAYPIAEMGFVYQLPEYHSDLAINIRAAPVIDRVRAILSERLDTSLRATFRFTPFLLLNTGLGVVQTLPPSDPEALTGFTGDTALAFRPNRAMEFNLGLRGVWQTVRSVDASIASWVLFASATFQAPTVLF